MAKTAAALSKSKLMAFRQCPKRLWLEVYRPDERMDSDQAMKRFDIGENVGDIARRLYDPENEGILIERQPGAGNAGAIAKTAELLSTPRPLFEAGFCAEGALAFADILLPARKNRRLGWKMIEIKSSGSLKDYHLDDAALQSFVARKAGLPLLSLALAHIALICNCPPVLAGAWPIWSRSCA